MSWHSPFQSTKRGAVPFPALTPWANSPGQPSDAGSPMQTTPTPVAKSVARKGTTTIHRSRVHSPSPMDAAPYTPLSARRGVLGQAPDTTANFVGKLSFTPHIRQQRQHGLSPASKRSPVASPDQRSATAKSSHAHPPVVSMYAPSTDSNASDQSGMAQPSSNAGSTASACSGPPATAAGPNSTPARPHSPSTWTANHAAVPQQASLLQSRFAAESAQQLFHTAHSMSAFPDPAGTSEPKSNLQFTSASGPGHLRHSSLQPSSSVPGNLSHMQTSSGGVTPNIPLSRRAAQAASAVDHTNPEKLQLPFRGAPTALSAELLQTALPSSHPPAHMPRPGAMSAATGLLGSVPSSLHSKWGLPTMNKVDFQRSGMYGKRSMLCWEPVQASVDSPEKQELGRRIFGGLPVPSPKTAKQASATKSPASGSKSRWQGSPPSPASPAGTSQTRDTHAAPDGSTAAVDLERPVRSENSAQQLQWQVAQAATAAGVLIEQIGSDGVQSEPMMLPESWQDIVKRVQQLQQDAVPLAVRVKAQTDMHASAIPSRASMGKTKTVIPILPKPGADVSEHGRQNKAVPSTRLVSDVASMLDKLHVLQQEGLRFASRM